MPDLDLNAIAARWQDFHARMDELLASPADAEAATLDGSLVAGMYLALHSAFRDIPALVEEMHRLREDATWVARTESDRLDSYQERTRAWAAKHWPGEPVWRSAVGLAEEVGELCRCVLKRDRLHRGTVEEWTAELRKEAGDVAITLLHLAALETFSLIEVIEERLAEIERRDINHHPIGASDA